MIFKVLLPHTDSDKNEGVKIILTAISNKIENTKVENKIK